MTVQKTIIAAALLIQLGAYCPSAYSQNLVCEIGPIAKEFGGTKWLVYACDDNKSIVIVTAPGNPAMPFYFAYYPENGGYRLTGEGTGNRNATSAAYEELKALSGKDIEALIKAAKNA